MAKDPGRCAQVALLLGEQVEALYAPDIFLHPDDLLLETEVRTFVNAARLLVRQAQWLLQREAGEDGNDVD